MVLAFITQTIVALAQVSGRGAKSNLAMLSMFPTDLWSWVAAAETAAWSLRWIMIPVTFLVLYGGRKLYRSVKESPTEFCGLRYARRGYIASLAVPLVVLILIGVTVPERLRRRQMGIEAGFNAKGYQTDRLLIQYREQFGTLPSDLKDLARLPDPDGSIANLLNEIDSSNYKASADLAVIPTKKPQQLRGAVIRNASVNTASDEPLSEGLSFTNYELRLPGYDKVLNTDDDLIVRDGLITKASETPRRLGSTTVSK